MGKEEMISDDDNDFNDSFDNDDGNDNNEGDTDEEEEEGEAITPTTTPKEVRKKDRPMPACKKAGKPSTSSKADNEGRTTLKTKRKSAPRKIHIKKDESQKCQFCCLKFENWSLFSSHIKEKHTGRLEERKQLKVKDVF